MRAIVIGVKRMSGVGKESGKNFDFAQVEILRPMEVTASPKFTLVGFGYETSKIDLAVEALDRFRDVRFPSTLELTVDTVPGRQGLRSVVTGFRASDVKAA